MDCVNVFACMVVYVHADLRYVWKQRIYNYVYKYYWMWLQIIVFKASLNETVFSSCCLHQKARWQAASVVFMDAAASTLHEWRDRLSIPTNEYMKIVEVIPVVVKDWAKGGPTHLVDFWLQLLRSYACFPQNLPSLCKHCGVLTAFSTINSTNFFVQLHYMAWIWFPHATQCTICNTRRNHVYSFSLMSCKDAHVWTTDIDVQRGVNVPRKRNSWRAGPNSTARSFIVDDKQIKHPVIHW